MMKYEILLQGGFANQLFQFAHALETHPDGNLGKFIINDISYKAYHRNEVLSRLYPINVEKTIRRRRNLYQQRLITKLSTKRLFINESNPFHKPRPVKDISRNEKIIQIGYFQNYRSITRQRSYLFQNLASLSTKSRVVQENEVAIHVRRGDYVSNPAANKYHGVPTDQYYTEAYDYILKSYPETEFTVFTDDRSYAEIIFHNRPIKEFVSGELNDDVIDFVYMSKFSKYIISNSSYSYIASLLNTKLDFVIAPKMWTNLMATDDTDLAHHKMHLRL